MPSDSTPRELDGWKVLVVEDQPLEALDYCDRLIEAGAEIVGPVSSVAEALDIVGRERVDVALLDYALADQNSQKLQVALDAHRIPFVVLTGYPLVLVRRDEQQKVLSKPVSAHLLRLSVRAAAMSADR